MSIAEWDQYLIRAWHEGWHPEVLDAVVPLWREKSTWIPLYVALVAWLFWRKRLWGLANAAAIAIAVGLGDLTSAGLLKPLFGRLRPCNLPGLREHLDLLTGCGPGLSLPSAHATNHFALAVALGVTCFAERPLPKWLALLWAGSIAVGQVYVGRHYLTDILMGAGLGTLIGWAVGRGYAATEAHYGVRAQPRAGTGG